MINALRRHWPEYLAEAWALGLFMLSAAVFTVLCFHPASLVPRWIPSAMVRRFIVGCAMGGTAIINIYSPWGRRSGAHMNPAFTLAFYRLGRIAGVDAAWYAVAQFIGGAVGVLVSALLLRRWIADPSVAYIVTVPGPQGELMAFGAELLLSGILVFVVLAMVSSPRLAPRTGWMAGLLVALFITFEAPLSGMSINPARTLGSAVVAGVYTSLWIYFLAPPLGMLLAAQLHGLWRANTSRGCAKLSHDSSYRCIFCEHAVAAAGG